MAVSKNWRSRSPGALMIRAIISGSTLGSHAFGNSHLELVPSVLFASTCSWSCDVSGSEVPRPPQSGERWGAVGGRRELRGPRLIEAPMNPKCRVPLSYFEQTPCTNGSKRVVGYQVLGVHWAAPAQQFMISILHGLFYQTPWNCDATVNIVYIRACGIYHQHCD